MKRVNLCVRTIFICVVMCAFVGTQTHRAYAQESTPPVVAPLRSQPIGEIQGQIAMQEISCEEANGELLKEAVARGICTEAGRTPERTTVPKRESGRVGTNSTGSRTGNCGYASLTVTPIGGAATNVQVFISSNGAPIWHANYNINLVNYNTGSSTSRSNSFYSATWTHYWSTTMVPGFGFVIGSMTGTAIVGGSLCLVGTVSTPGDYVY